MKRLLERKKFTTTLNNKTLEQLEIIKIDLNRNMETRIRGLNEVIEILVEERWEKINDKHKGKISKEEIEKLVDERLKEELAAGVQTIQYQINTLMTTNGQTPFVTLFLYLNPEDPYIEENALIIEEILNQRLQGIKNE